MKEKQINLLNKQIITSILFIISLFISILLTYDEKQNILKKKTIFSNKSKYINLFNRILALIIIAIFLYINYETYEIQKKKGSKLDPFRHQIYASIFSLISAVIVLYVVLENWNSNPNITSIENPTI